MQYLQTVTTNKHQLQQQHPHFAHLFESDFVIALYQEVLRKTDSVAEAREAARVAALFARQLSPKPTRTLSA